MKQDSILEAPYTPDEIYCWGSQYSGGGFYSWSLTPQSEFLFLEHPIHRSNPPVHVVPGLKRVLKLFLKG